jgi:diguanylate cyclase (GGDEF)-like protein
LSSRATPAPAAGSNQTPQALAYLLIALVVAALVAAAWYNRAQLSLTSNLEGQALEWQLRLRGPLQPASPVGITILAIDDRTASALGGLPLDRSTWAQVVDRLVDAGVAWIGFDVLFPDPSRHEPDGDQRFAAAIQRAGNVVLPFALPSSEQGPSLAPASAASAPPEVSDRVLDAALHRYRDTGRGAVIAVRPTSLVAPLPLLAQAARGLGHVSAHTSLDGAVRIDLPVIGYAGEYYPSMALALAALASGVDPKEIEAGLGDAVQFGTRRVPLDETSQQWINYLGPMGTFPTLSLVDLLQGRVPTDQLRGRLVLIGSTALGTGDTHRTPFDTALPGVERMATVIDNLLAETSLRRPTWTARLELAGILALPLLASFGIARLPPRRALWLVVLAGLVLVLVAQVLLVGQRVILSFAFPLAALVLAAAAALAWRALAYERARRVAEQQLRASEERFALAARGANDGLWDWRLPDPSRAGDEGSTYLSPRARQLMDLPEGDAPVSLPAWMAGLTPVEREKLETELQAHLDGRSQQLHHELRHERAGETRWLLVRGVAVREAGRPVRMAGSLTDITEAKRLEGQITFDALHDRLTGLANRDLFADRLGQWLGAADRHAPPAEAGLALVDIDGFRAINEARGYVVGNQVLIETAGRLSALIGQRESQTLLARIGPDQFALATQGTLEEMVELARAAQAALRPPLAALGGTEGLSVTVAVAHSEHGLDGVDELFNGASLALAQAKRAGTGAIRSFDAAEQALQNSRRWLDENIDLALAAGDQFQLHYQPFVRLSDRALIGFEALIRWQHPSRGLVMPGDFIPHAEQSGRINAIGQWTMFEAARQLVAWDAIGFQGEVAVNLSGRQFTETDLEADAQQVLTLLGTVAPRRFKLEVTESMAMENPFRTTKVLNRLAEMGFKISIDDFGTGYSSLAYLHRFPFDTLKIDRSFVIRLSAGREAREIVRTIVGLGAALDKQVLAEGVEDEAQARELEALGVQVGQGWLFARAMPVAGATALIADTRLP